MIPRRFASAYVVKAIAPGVLRRGVKRTALEPLAKEDR